MPGVAAPLPDGVAEGVPGPSSRGKKVPGRWWLPGRTDLPASWSAKVSPVTVMSRAPALKRMMVARRTRPVSPVRLVENVVLITGPIAAPGEGSPLAAEERARDERADDRAQDG